MLTALLPGTGAKTRKPGNRLYQRQASKVSCHFWRQRCFLRQQPKYLSPFGYPFRASVVEIKGLELQPVRSFRGVARDILQQAMPAVRALDFDGRIKKLVEQLHQRAAVLGATPATKTCGVTIEAISQQFVVIFHPRNHMHVHSATLLKLET